MKDFILRNIGLVLSIIFVGMIMFGSLVGCNSKSQDSMINPSENTNRFQLVEKIGDSSTYDAIYVDTYTGVEYFVHQKYNVNGHDESWAVPLLDADGLPLLAPGYSRGDD